MATVSIDLVMKDPWSFVLVEQGPWGVISDGLASLSARIGALTDVALDGKLAELYPGSKGQPIHLCLDCYDVPQNEVSELFERFTQFVASDESHQADIRSGPHASIDFKLTFGALPSER